MAQNLAYALKRDRRGCLGLRHQPRLLTIHTPDAAIWHSVCPIQAGFSTQGELVAVKRAPLERRRHERIPLAIPVFVRGADSEGKEFLEFATALNISAGGALLATRRHLPRFAQLSLEIPSAPLPRMPVLPKAVRRLRARLLRVTVLDGYQLWGLRFSSAVFSSPVSRRKVPSER
ncbi:MAG TPA: PilZ domain-containing protein [Terriglobales bacterium]|nr:PilZ domain-containing protein [Terriglobales bacterium]